METSKIKPVTFNIKKNKRHKAKKRKLEALLNLFQTEEQIGIDEKKQKASETVQDEFKALKDELKRFMKKPEVDPCFYLTELGCQSKFRLKSKISKKVRPLFVENVYQVLLKSVIGHMSPYQFVWAKLEQPQNIPRTVLLIVEGLPKSLLVENRSSLLNLLDIFPNMVEIASSNLPFPQELTTLHKVTHFHIENKDSYSTMFPSKKVVKVENEENSLKPSRLHLLLSPIQLVMENYPLPQSVFKFSKSENYTFSKDTYAAVSSDSPMFALDCEMCRTEKSPNDLTRVAVVNEKLEIIYDTLVKPKSKIIDYMTKFSGITKKMLKGVTTTLEDVQNELRTILPPDAILCGQSLNCDLHALKMIHPYCIDTSVIFNGTGIRAKKDSLKYLSMVHLNENIQNSKKGHNPVEDALATMKLVQLKLDNSLEFGDMCLKENVPFDNRKEEDPDGKEASAEAGPSNKKEESFFSLTSKHNKKVCLIGDAQTLDLYGADVPKTIPKIMKSTADKSVKAILNHMGEFDLTIGHVDFKTCEEPDLIGEFDRIVKLLFDACSHRTMFMVLTSNSDESNFEDIRSGIFMAAIKKAVT